MIKAKIKIYSGSLSNPRRITQDLGHHHCLDTMATNWFAPIYSCHWPPTTWYKIPS